MIVPVLLGHLLVDINGSMIVSPEIVHGCQTQLHTNKYSNVLLMYTLSVPDPLAYSVGSDGTSSTFRDHPPIVGYVHIKSMWQVRCTPSLTNETELCSVSGCEGLYIKSTIVH